MHSDPFCSPTIYAQVYYESTYFMVAYSYMPILPGHSLIIPKRHITDIIELNEAEARDLFTVIKKVTPILLKVYHSTRGSYNFSAQIGNYSGRTVPHLHFHIVPRKKGDKFYKDSNMLYDALTSKKWKFTKSEAFLHKEYVQKEVKRLRKLFRYTPDIKVISEL